MLVGMAEVRGNCPRTDQVKHRADTRQVFCDFFHKPPAPIQGHELLTADPELAPLRELCPKARAHLRAVQVPKDARPGLTAPPSGVLPLTQPQRRQSKYLGPSKTPLFLN